jgi:hypothetical protein
MQLFALKTKSDFIEAEPLGQDENPFSTNKVTGHSLNFPITGTCQPTSVCSATCYFAKGPSTWTAALYKQKRLQSRLDSDPNGLADQIAEWALRLRLTFVRWHGGGDMTANSARCINRVASLVPSIPQWIVTRKISLAIDITPAENVYVHLSVDMSSWNRLVLFAENADPVLQWFWSYQCDRGEVPPVDVAPVVFRDGYKPMSGERPANYDCPLNWVEDITGACVRCRQCFNGEAVKNGRHLIAQVIPQAN